MELFGKLRTRIGNNLLRKKAERLTRKKFYSGINEVRKIGVVWDASSLDEFPVLARFCQTMQERNIEVTIKGYYSGKILPDQYTAIRYLTCIRRNELGFFYHPLSGETASFINQKFDVLIDANFNDILPLRYLSVLSLASFKAGIFRGEKDEQQYDLMIEMKDPVNLESFLNETLTYLEMINSGEPKKEKILY